jgi:hypothetical protein
MRQNKEMIDYLFNLISKGNLSSLEELLKELDHQKIQAPHETHLFSGEQIKLIGFISRVKSFLHETLYPPEGKITDEEMENFKNLDGYKLTDGFFD